MSASPPPTLEDFMAQALAMEREAVDRYRDFADAMEVHNNTEVAALFRTMAGYEAKHAEEILHQMGWASDPPPTLYHWPELESPEAVPFDEAHYLMQPWHALNLALAAEQRAEAFFGRLAAATTNEAVREAALELQREEQEHVELVRRWMKKFPEPEGDWDNDPDPPRYLD
ncbi:MAG: ferritin family protein [Burkholderiales bacterium]|nr:ferritin family protein [Burkholderiales bacterium]MDE2397221.1 ferritin family protein [Burkholderiales bacterium]MDE2453393.1 ferritin family protein [Burkholderiales bacterium]